MFTCFLQSFLFYVFFAKFLRIANYCRVYSSWYMRYVPGIAEPPLRSWDHNIPVPTLTVVHRCLIARGPRPAAHPMKLCGAQATRRAGTWMSGSERWITCTTVILSYIKRLRRGNSAEYLHLRKINI